ncbi:M28 family peptidase [Chryseobacterium wangxinyae]|uniref:M28 family peptidase n=1 Tax=unclassified Chryseobacterium TaxID=2593645 RepID=UPI00226D6D37|nr:MULTISPECIES: M28 family peptidase [unclassified Chryseobacterium]MCY0969623.1 M28 family peptidase [Chryseobacterium sp. CY353]MCY0975891.1 M28 family peptidase [Chryseobacterium sp. CY350]WBZ94503.1 M28 family peptidase [Chryseobacterium sp. CY350]
MKKITYLFLSLLSVATFAQQVSSENVKTILSTLASDEMKGREIGTPENDYAANYIAKLFKENNLEYCVGDSYLVPFDYKGQTVYNVCGIKKGKSEKTLGFSGHFDHIGTNKKPGDNIYNGADDDASGITTLIGIAEYFKNKKPEFSMVYMAFNGEEKGMLGSTAITADKKLDKIYSNLSALFNFEMVATESEFGKNAVFITGDEFSDLDELFNDHAENGLKIYPDPYASEQLFYRSDNVSFVKKKIIAHSISTADMSKIKHYHQVNDDMTIVDLENLTQIINNFGKTLEKLSPKNFNPKYNDKVKFN